MRLAAQEPVLVQDDAAAEDDRESQMVVRLRMVRGPSAPSAVPPAMPGEEAAALSTSAAAHPAAVCESAQSLTDAQSLAAPASASALAVVGSMVHVSPSPRSTGKAEYTCGRVRGGVKCRSERMVFC